MTTAIAILNYNGAALLREFLPSVLEHSENAKVYVIDNPQPMTRWQYLRKLFLPLHP